MRVALSVLVCALALAMPVSAGDVSPRALVLQPTDVPAYRLDRKESGVKTNATLAKNDPDAPALIARAGRVTGYLTAYSHTRDRGLWSWADLFRKPSGARVIFAYAAREMSGHANDFRCSRLDLGEQALLCAGPRGEELAVVIWRYRRVFAALGGERLSTARTVALARVQQRGIAAALR